jgi:hypothetical protein
VTFQHVEEGERGERANDEHRGFNCQDDSAVGMRAELSLVLRPLVPSTFQPKQILSHATNEMADHRDDRDRA